MTQSSLIFVNKVKDEYHQVDYCNDQINNRIYSCSCTSTINEKVFINSKERIFIMLNQLVFSISVLYFLQNMPTVEELSSLPVCFSLKLHTKLSNILFIIQLGLNYFVSQSYREISRNSRCLLSHKAHFLSILSCLSPRAVC